MTSDQDLTDLLVLVTRMYAGTPLKPGDEDALRHLERLVAAYRRDHA